MFMIYGKDNKVVLPLEKDRWYRVELLQEPSKKNGKVNSFFLSRSGSSHQELLTLTTLTLYCQSLIPSPDPLVPKHGQVPN